MLGRLDDVYKRPIDDFLLSIIFFQVCAEISIEKPFLSIFLQLTHLL